MPMQELQVGQVRLSVEDSRLHMVDLNVSPVEKERSTPGTPPVRSLEQDADPAHGQRMLTQPLGPVHEIAVEWTGGAGHFHMALDGCVRVVHEAESGRSRKLQSTGGAAPPVLVEHRFPTLLIVTATSPMSQRAHQVVVA